MPNYFIAGTDTDIGKTFITCVLLSALAGLENTTRAFKPISCGVEQTPYGYGNSDALLLQRHSTESQSLIEVNPFVFDEFISPNFAASHQKTKLTVADVVSKLNLPQAFGADYNLVEGVGGWFVPINETETMNDLAVVLQLPVILVVGMRLGCLSHSLLTAAGIKQSGLKLAGWVANCIDPDMLVLDENIQCLQDRLQAPCLGVVPYSPHAQPSDLTRHLNLKAIQPGA